MMTQEQKAKAYDEMVQRVKELHKAGNDLTKKQMEIICPELAESEDERMLNKLIDHLDWHSNNRLTHEECDELRSWLKKKKEHQNNSDAREKALGRDLTFSQDKDKNLDEIAQDYVDGVKEYNPEPTWDLMQTAVCYGYHYCEMKEHKPKQYDIDVLEKHITKDSISELAHTVIVRNGWEIVEKEQKPVEWNDTDMKEARDNLVSVCRDWELGKQTTLLPIVAVRARYFLEHLTEPKPAEWSEEDGTVPCLDN